MTFLWYFYQVNDTSMILLVRYFKMYHSSILLYVSYLSLRSAKKWYFDTFFIKKLFTYEHILNGKSKKYLIWNLIDTNFASKPLQVVQLAFSLRAASSLSFGRGDKAAESGDVDYEYHHIIKGLYATFSSWHIDPCRFPWGAGDYVYWTPYTPCPA